ncbi:protein disulfide isomerase-like 5-4 isoform X1 [Dendrobium catenatum]|uniref:Protein disulfide isomerase-like 5-4 n=1 Tax=Dendrobium catenatum TaxID=906689 RepID=A0A2I0W1X3_9ASPA|nr:protein disulfide isomerase-like 5-4 isoform X1 [Dendrobium catenatum]PKU69628.1 Protein disulfide isomerase-like 5-4 [Dendrobium catenatum]
MISSSKLKAVDFYRKIPRDLTEASLSGAGLSIIAALSMVFLFGMELNDYMTVNTSTAVVVDRSPDGEFLRIDFNISFPSLSCEFASVDVSDILGTNRLNITKTIRKFSIDPNLKPTGSEYHPGPIPTVSKHGDDFEEESGDGSVLITTASFDQYAHQYAILAVNFYAPWCYWSNRLRPAWERTAKIIRERYDPEVDGRILMGKVDCTEQINLCRRHHIQGYPSIRIFRKGSDVREDHGHHEHESYYGERDTDSLVAAMETLVASIPKVFRELALEDKSEAQNDSVKRPAPSTSGCRVEGFVRVKKVPGNLIISARSGAHSFDASLMNVSHVISHFSFGKKLSQRMHSEMKRLTPLLGGSYDRLADKSYIISHDDNKANVTIEHYLQLVKTEIVTRKSSKELKLFEEYEYTAHSSLVHSLDIPVSKFHFEPSPMQVLVTEIPKSFSHFITNLCAITGGVFTVAGILDSILHNTMRIVKKVELGKQF